jgi:hypothetical protein
MLPNLLQVLEKNIARVQMEVPRIPKPETKQKNQKKVQAKRRPQRPETNMYKEKGTVDRKGMPCNRGIVVESRIDLLTG